MPTPTWERLPEAKRQAVLAAAQDEFGRAGFGGASLNTVAREAGVAKGSLFQYFDDKVDLYAHLSHLAALRVRAAMEDHLARAPQDDLLAAFDALTVAWVCHFYDHPLDRRLTAGVVLEPHPELQAIVSREVNGHFAQVLGPLLRGYVRAGALDPGTDVDALVTLLVVTCTHLATAPHLTGLDPVLGLTGASREDACATGRRLVSLLIRPWVRARPTGRPGGATSDG